jgi:hypothetical protein
LHQRRARTLPGFCTDRVVRPKHFYLEIFLASFAGLLLEISYTRVFSFKVSS